MSEECKYSVGGGPASCPGLLAAPGKVLLLMVATSAPSRELRDGAPAVARWVADSIPSPTRGGRAAAAAWVATEALIPGLGAPCAEGRPIKKKSKQAYGYGISESGGSRRLLRSSAGREKEKYRVISKSGCERREVFLCSGFVGLCQDAKFALTWL